MEWQLLNKVRKEQFSFASNFKACFESIERTKHLSTQKFWEECAGKTNALVIAGMYLSPGFSEAERPLHSTNNNNNKKALADPIQIAEDDFCVLDQCLRWVLWARRTLLDSHLQLLLPITFHFYSIFCLWVVWYGNGCYILILTLIYMGQITCKQ